MSNRKILQEDIFQLTDGEVLAIKRMMKSNEFLNYQQDDPADQDILEYISDRAYSLILEEDTLKGKEVIVTNLDENNVMNDVVYQDKLKELEERIEQLEYPDLHVEKIRTDIVEACDILKDWTSDLSLCDSSIINGTESHLGRITTLCIALMDISKHKISKN